MFTLLIILLLAGAVLWTCVLSISVVGPDEVGVLFFLGEQKGPVLNSGWVFAPWTPFKWCGHPLYELVHIPTKMFEISYEGKKEHKIWSSDHQLLIVETSVYVRFPYKDNTALIRMIQSSVPTTQEGLKIWMKDEVIRVVRQVMSKRDYKVAISDSDGNAIVAEANKAFSRRDGLLVRSGVYGTDVADTNPGKGEVFLKIEQVLLTQSLQEKLELVESAKLDAFAAESVAQQKAATVGKPIDLMMDQWVKAEAKRHGIKSVEEATKLLKKDGSYQKQVLLYKDLILADEDSLEVNRIEVGAPDGTPLGGDLGSLAAAAALFSGRSRGNFGGHGNRKKGAGKKKKPEDMDNDEAAEGAFGSD